MAKPCLGYPSRTAAATAMRAEGMTFRQIAERIGINIETVSALLSNRRDRNKPDGRSHRRRKLTDAQLDEMCALLERGWGTTRIAQHFTDAGTPITASSIDWKCMRLGADAPVRLRGRTPSKLVAYNRSSGAVRPYSEEEDRILLTLTAAGTSHKSICEQLGRATSSVRGRLLILARRQAREEDLAA